MRDKHSVALILPYYGTFPNYFPLWLKSVGYNKNFDFLVFTDADFSCYDVPNNVHFFKSTLDDIKSRIRPHLDFDFVVNTPYKVCDYKPIYGLIFQDYLQDYEFWGNVDPDVIWGDMSKFITPEIFDKYDRIYNRGHLTIFRNTDKINHFVLHKLPGWNISYRDIYSTDETVGFDEISLNYQLFSKFVGDKRYYRYDYADIHPYYKQFIQCKVDEVIPAFRWQNGKVFGIGNKGELSSNYEFLYVHLQKRAMKFTPGLENEDSFLIVPNEFLRDHELTDEEIKIFTASDVEYEKFVREKYNWCVTPKKQTISERIRVFWNRPIGEKIYRFKFRWNKFFDRKLPDPYE